MIPPDRNAPEQNDWDRRDDEPANDNHPPLPLRWIAAFVLAALILAIGIAVCAG